MRKEVICEKDSRHTATQTFETAGSNAEHEDPSPSWGNEMGEGPLALGLHP